MSKPANQTRLISVREAAALGYSTWLFWEVAMSFPIRETRTVPRGDTRLVNADNVMMQRSVRVVPLSELQKRRAPTRHPDLMTALEVAQFTKGAFTNRLPCWESAGCPFLSDRRKLKVIRQDGISKGTKRVKRIPEAKHYLRSEIEEAWQTFKKMARRKGVHVDEEGRTWLTGGAAFRKYEIRAQALAHWRDRGILDVKELPRSGPGRYQKTTYFRELGARGIAGLVKLQRPGDGHIVLPSSNGIQEAEHRMGAEEAAAEKAYPVRDDELRKGQIEQTAILKQILERIIGDQDPGKNRLSLREADKAIIEVLESHDEFLTGSEIATKAGFTYEYTRERLPLLKKDGRLDWKKGKGYKARCDTKRSM
jgi:hypothetical protein